ncbi:protein HEXIM-like [Acanthaster planci]|uniref:Protein HEXIM-like n=1 Tax=Acanthaster planci TaxID=133434 RepID=A0A8B7XZZ6_ACAPL|nr:protein HEXIM-like [Acanthaster planci]
MEGQKRVSFGTESVEGDDERTENERSPDVSPITQCKWPRTASGGFGRHHTVVNSGGSGTDLSRRAPRTRNRPNHRRSSSASGSETGQPQENQEMAPSIEPSNDNQSGGSPQQARENVKNGGAPHHKADENLRRRRRNNRKRSHRKWKPYSRLTWEERKELDELESKRATKKRANRPTPYNTTQFLMEDHKVDTPDLSAGGNHIPGDSSDELFDENDDIRDGDFLEREFSAMYDEVQSERLQSMSKEQLVSEVLTLSKRVNELEETRQASDGEQMNGHSISKDAFLLRARLESLDDLEHEVQRLREENSVLKKANHSQGLAESS